MIIKIAGKPVDYEYNTINLDDAIGERSTASFSIIDREGNQTFQKGQKIEILVVNESSVLATWNADDLTATWEEDL